MNTLQELLNWHEQQRRVSMMAPMMSGDSLNKISVHDSAVKVLKAAIQELEAAHNGTHPSP